MNNIMTKIQVTQDDIDKGQHCTSRFCPVANSITRITGRNVVVGIDDFNFLDNCSRSYKIPIEARNKIRTWDSHNRMEPFEFEINIDY